MTETEAVAPLLNPMPSVPGTLSAQVGDLIVAVHPGDCRATVLLAAEVAALTAAQCRQAAAALLEAAQVMEG